MRISFVMLASFLADLTKINNGNAEAQPHPENADAGLEYEQLCKRRGGGGGGGRGGGNDKHSRDRFDVPNRMESRIRGSKPMTQPGQSQFHTREHAWRQTGIPGEKRLRSDLVPGGNKPGGYCGGGSRRDGCETGDLAPGISSGRSRYAYPSWMGALLAMALCPTPASAIHLAQSARSVMLHGAASTSITGSIALLPLRASEDANLKPYEIASYVVWGVSFGALLLLQLLGPGGQAGLPTRQRILAAVLFSALGLLASFAQGSLNGVATWAPLCLTASVIMVPTILEGRTQGEGSHEMDSQT